MNRRDFLRAGVRGGVALGMAKAIHNTMVGYGHLGVGGNLTSQDLATIAAENLSVANYFNLEIDEYDVHVSNGDLRYATPAGERLTVDDGDAPARIEALATDLDDLRRGSFDFRFSSPDEFFAEHADSNTRDTTVEVLRGPSYTRADSGVVDAFAGTPPTASEALLRGLADGFREHSRYDIPRYLAGSVDDNLLPVDADLRDPFRPEEAFEPMLAQDDAVGLFCAELTRMANRAVRSVPAPDQTIPLYGLYVRNQRNKHAYNAFGTVTRVGDRLELPITFVDYTHTTLYDDLRVTPLLGDGFDAYNRWHRADEIIW